MPGLVRMSGLKTAVMVPFVGFVLMLAIGVGALEYRKFRQDIRSQSQDIRSAIEASFDASVKSEAAGLEAIARAIGNDKALALAFQRRDREAVRQMVAPLFDQLHDGASAVTHLYFIEPSRVAFWRAHQPDRHGDVIARHTMLSAQGTGAASHGIELGPMGTLTLRVVVPWVEAGRLVGYIETGKEIDHLFDGLRTRFGLRPVVFLPKVRLDRPEWEATMARLGRQARWNEFADKVVYLRGDLPESVLRPVIGRSEESAQAGEHWYDWVRLDIRDASGEPAASIGLVRDVTQSQRALRDKGLAIAALVTLGGALVIALFWLVIDRVERQLMRARQELATREAMYHSLFSDARIAMLLIAPDEDGAIVDANDAALAYYGYSRDELCAKRIGDINTLSRPEVAAEMARARAQSRSHFFFRHRLASGEIRDVEVHSGPIGVKGRPLLYSIVHDITDRRHLEEERRLLVMAVEQSPVSIVITDSDARIQYVNAAFTRTSGYAADEVLGENPRMLQSGETNPDEYLAMWGDLASGNSWTGVFHNKRKDGGLYWEQAHISPVLDDGGKITHYVGIKEDISDRKLAEERLKESEERFRSLIEGTTDWVWETDDNHCFTWISPSFENVIRIRVAEILGRHRWDLASECHEIDPTRWQAHIADLTALRSFRDFRYWIRLADGSARWVSVSGAPRFDDKGRFLGYRGSGSDVTGFAEISNRLRTMVKVVEQSSVLVVITDTDGIITYVNPYVCTVTGFTAEELVGIHATSLSARALPAPEEERLWTTLRQGGTWTGEFLNRRKDGAPYWVQAVIFPVANEEGRQIHYVSIMEDVTGRKDSEARLLEQMNLTRHHYESLRALSDIAALRTMGSADQLARALVLGCRHLGLPIGIISRIEGERYTVVHHHAPAESGLADGQDFPLGNTYCSMTLEAGDVVAIPYMGRSARSGHPCYGAFGLEAYIGAPVVVRGQRFGTVNFSSPHPFERAFDDGDFEFMRLLARWVGAVIERGMTERDIHAALDAAEAAKRRADLLLASAGEGIFGIDGDARITFANPAALRLLGCVSEDQLIGREAHAVTGHVLEDGHSCREGDCAITQTLADGLARRRDCDQFHGGAGLFPVEFAVTAITQEDAITGAVVAFHDISERREAEKRIGHQAEELSRINAELEQFAYVASHDLRQPLRMVSSYLTLIEKSAGESFSDEVHKYFEFAVDGAKRMDRLILGLLDYSRTGRNTRPPEPVPLAEAVAESLDNLTVAIREVDARISVADDLPVVSGDRSDLVRLFQNLIGNAVKYRAPDRPLEISVGWRRQDDEVVVWVRDNGAGIAPEHFDRAFQIFQRLVPASAVEGSGLGLAICKKIVSNHHGRIWIESQPGEGATFLVAFPVAATEGRP